MVVGELEVERDRAERRMQERVAVVFVGERAERLQSGGEFAGRWRIVQDRAVPIVHDDNALSGTAEPSRPAGGSRWRTLSQGAYSPRTSGPTAALNTAFSFPRCRARSSSNGAGCTGSFTPAFYQ